MDAKPPESGNTEYVCKADKDLHARLSNLEKVQRKPLAGTQISYGQIKEMTLVGSWLKTSETKFASPYKSIGYSKAGSKLSFDIFKNANGVAKEKEPALNKLLDAEIHKLSDSELALVQPMIRDGKVQSGNTKVLKRRKIVIARGQEKNSKSIHVISFDRSGKLPFQVMTLSGPEDEFDKYLPDFTLSINSIEWPLFGDELKH